ncbi:MAG: glycine--tRNA ligase, partial [Chloroflexota bacterium]
MPDMEIIVSLAKRRGFIFQSSEIYGGLASTWDYGPLGVELKRNVKEAWWRTFVHGRDDMVGLDASILMARQVWAASGHEKGFSDPLVDCRLCKQRFRADQVFVGTWRQEPSITVSVEASDQYEAMEALNKRLREPAFATVAQGRASQAGLAYETLVEYLGRHQKLADVVCPNSSCSGKGSLTEPRQFSLMFKTFLGPVEDDTAQTYLRPETAQGIF